MAYDNSSIGFSVEGSETVTIPASEWARYLRYFWRYRHKWVLAKEMARDLDTIEIHPRLSQLRNRFGLVIDDKPGPRRQKLYRLNQSVKVVEAASDG